MYFLSERIIEVFQVNHYHRGYHPQVPARWDDMPDNFRNP